jgi:1,5-anhydro-D-fructose reductase (1,5-anhydro-D-mannitol-forming)
VPGRSPRRLAVLGAWHVHAKDYAREAAAHPGVDLAVVWDPDGERGRAFAAEWGAAFEPDLRAVLARAGEDLHGAVVTTATRDHEEVIPAALQAGLPVFAEKVLAPSRDGAERIAAVARETGLPLHVSLPRLAFGTTRAARGVVDAGDLGRVTHGRVRVAHNGAAPTAEQPAGWLPARFFDPSEAAGGALIDLGAHPLYLLRELLGMPADVAASYGFATGRAVEDHAVVVLRYADGALGVAETGFVSAGPFTELEVNGTEGNLLLSPHDGVLRLRRRGGPWEEVAVPADGPTPFESWVARLPERRPDPANLAAALDLSALAEAANRSAAAGRPVAVPGPGVGQDRR